MAYCFRCQRSFGSFGALNRHREDSKRHNDCVECQLDFESEQGLIQHYVQSPHHHYCQPCNQHFDHDNHLLSHYEQEHDCCYKCDKLLVFRNEIGLHEHNRQKHRHIYCEPCKRIFESQNNLRAHLNSSTHKPKDIPCPTYNCGKAFGTQAALALHLESGTCVSGVNRQRLNHVVSTLDRGNVITNPNRLICAPNGNVQMTLQGSERCWNGYRYECFLCHREFRILSALNAHLKSPAHEQSIYRCPPRWGGCNQDFNTLSGLFMHVESESCGVKRFQRNMNDAIGSITDGMRRIGF